jgi:hypothetical protein
MPPMTKKTQPTLDVEHKDEEDAFEVELDDSRDDDLDVDDGSGSVDAHTRVLGSQYFPSFSFSKTAKWGVLIFAVVGVAGYAGGLVFGDHAKSSTNTAASLNKKFPKSSKKPKSSKSEAPSMAPSTSSEAPSMAPSTSNAPTAVSLHVFIHLMCCYVIFEGTPLTTPLLFFQLHFYSAMFRLL